MELLDFLIRRLEGFICRREKLAEEFGPDSWEYENLELWNYTE